MKDFNYFDVIKFLAKYIRKYEKNFLMFYFGWFFDSILIVISPILFGIMIDEIVYYQNVNTFIQIASVFIVLTIFSCALYFLIYFQHSYLMNMYTFEIKKDIYMHFLKCEACVLTDSSAGDVITNLQVYSEECMHFVIRNIIHTINRILMMIAYAGCLLLIDWRIGGVVLFFAPLTIYINAKFGDRIKQYGDNERACYTSYTGWIYEVLSALQDIRMLRAEEIVKRSFCEKHNKMFETNNKFGFMKMTAGNIVSFLNLVCRLFIFVFAGYAVMNNKMTVGNITVVLSFYGSLVTTIRNLCEYYLEAQRRIPVIQHIYNFLQTGTENTWSGKDNLKVTDGQIKFTNVSFKYNEHMTVFTDFNVCINGGERVAIVGESGCGKTTLAYLLIGFFKIINGDITIDDKHLAECSLHSIRENIGLIPQDVFIFDDTIRENIIVSNRNATNEEIINACKAAELWEFIISLPQGLDTMIGRKGIGISGGEKQRIAIARIYLKNPKIIIFDEATASLDSETEKAIHKAWEKLLVNRTSIVIAHRLSSVLLCERTIMIENGSIVADGNPREMIKSNIKFKKLFAIRE